MAPWWVPVLILVIGISTGIWIHRQLIDKGVDVGKSWLIMWEITPASVFATGVVLYLVPAGYKLIMRTPVSWAPTGFFADLATFIGALCFCVSAIGWVDMIPNQTDDRTIPDSSEASIEG